MPSSGLAAALVLAILSVPLQPVRAAAVPHLPWLDSSMGLLQAELTARYGDAQRLRVRRGLAQTARYWRPEDGGAAEYEAFVRAQFVGDAPALDALFGRLEPALAGLEGHQAAIRREFRRGLDLGPLLPVDRILAGRDPAAHDVEDAYQDQLAFVALLNFPLASLEERLRDGGAWSSRQWAEAWLAERFGRRIPARALQASAAARAAAEAYLDHSRIRADHLVDGRETGLFPPGPPLLCHLGLRDAIRAQYGAGRGGLRRQKLLQRVMERVVEQSIPAAVLDRPDVQWDPETDTVTLAAEAVPAQASAQAAVPAADLRYGTLLEVFHAERGVDPHAPLAPTLIARRLGGERQLAEGRVRQLLEELCGSPLLARVAGLVRARLGRELEPFDLWYDGFRPGAGAGLDALARRRYPDAAAFRRDLPRLLRGLGFAPGQAAALAAGIDVEPARGSAHAACSGLPADPCRLRLRIGPGGMDFRAFSGALHGLGHAAAQRLALDRAEHPLAAGLPGPGFEEALAFLVQGQDLDLLDRGGTSAETTALAALDDFWSACAGAAAALVELDVWRWLYDHPEAAPGELREAVAASARSVWNRYYAPAFGRRDVLLLAIPDDLVVGRLDLADYPLGHLIARRLRRRIGAGGGLGPALARVAALGRLTPDLWLQRAAGAPLGSSALLEDAAEALGRL